MKLLLVFTEIQIKYGSYAFQHGLDYSQRTFANVFLDGNHTNLDKGWKINWKLSSTYSLLKDPDIQIVVNLTVPKATRASSSVVPIG